MALKPPYTQIARVLEISRIGGNVRYLVVADAPSQKKERENSNKHARVEELVEPAR